MKFTTTKNIILENPQTKPFLVDTYIPNKDGKLPLVIFSHGYKGYKDWGAWDLLASKFAEKSFFFVKFNFSHNGTSIENPAEFADLQSFGENNYTKELKDLDFVINFFSENDRIDSNNITLIGHSRGGGISIVKAFENPKIKNLITLASVDSLNRFPKNENFENWKKEGVFYSMNGRTKQNMPHFFQFYEDFEKNKSRFSVENAAQKLTQNFLIIHGREDEAVSMKSAENLHKWSKNSELQIIENTNHTFGAMEPWQENKLPDDLEKAVNFSLDFLKSYSVLH